MTYDDLQQRILDHAILASDGSHSARVWRVAEAVRDSADQGQGHDRLLHLMSRVGVLCRGLANDLRSDHTTAEQAAALLDHLADIGDLSFGEWLQR